jgi:hypothetical protein
VRLVDVRPSHYFDAMAQGTSPDSGGCSGWESGEKEGQPADGRID